MSARSALMQHGHAPVSASADDIPPPVGRTVPAAPINHRLPQRPPEQRRRRSPSRPADHPPPHPGQRIDEYAAGY